MLYVVAAVHGVTYLDNVMYVVCYESSTIHLYNTVYKTLTVESTKQLENVAIANALQLEAARRRAVPIPLSLIHI